MARPLKDARARGHLGRGTLVSFLLHLHLLVPLLVLVFIRAGQEEADKPEEVDVGFESVKPEQLPSDLPPLDDTPPPTAKNALAKVPEPPRPPAPEEPKVTPPPAPPEPEKKTAEATPPPAPVPPAPAPPVVPEKRESHEKVVDLDNDKNVEPPPNAKYLAQKNSRTEEETRATHTNLDRAQEGETDSSSSKKPADQRPPGDDKQKVADLEDQAGKRGGESAAATPRQEAESAAQSPPLKSPVLSLRGAMPRGHEITPETADPSLPHDPAGLLARPRPKAEFHDDVGEGGRLSAGQRVKLAMAGQDYERLFGAEAKAERQQAQRERSTRLGSAMSRRLAQVRSALENFIPDVKPGTRTVLNARAAPFAAFIARVHRQIHRFWGFGVLEDWDGLPGTSPFNKDSLMTTLEIVLNDNGTVNKIAVVKASGYMAYDAAAIDAVLTAAPFPEPPREIISNNGKVYFHWNFARDGRACGTEGVRYFILDNAPPDRAATKHG